VRPGGATRDLWGLTNLVASTVAELDDTPLYFTDDSGPESVVSLEALYV
jgi:hypothetical protein